jgi:DNA-binding beta-propeller fold protein YncE
VASFDSDAVTQLKWNQGLSQDVDPAACVSETGSGGDCVDGHALDQPFDVAVSPDAKNVYVASWGSHAIAVFDRNLGSGVLTQKAGTAACVSETGTGGLCADGVALQGPRGVTVSPDGKNVYATTDGSDAVVVFDRDAATGAISQKAGANGCISDTGSGGACTDGRGLDGAFDVVVSADGLSVFVTAGVSNALVIFDRSSATGALTQKVGKAGCISDTGTGGECIEGRGLSGARRLAVTDVGPSVYVAAVGSSTVSVFDRSPPPYDIDRDGQIDALTDALLLLRYTFGFRGATLVTGAVDLVNCTLCTAAEIEAFIDGLTP